MQGSGDFTSREMGGLWQLLQAVSTPVTAANGKVVCDSQIVPAGKHWLINALTFTLISLSVNFDMTKFDSGLYLCPSGTPADSIAPGGAIPNVSALPIRLDKPSEALNEANAGGTSFGLVESSVNPIIIPSLWFIRGIAGADGAPPANGPGIGAFGMLRGLFIQRDNC
jgi:hypothetical protein